MMKLKLPKLKKIRTPEEEEAQKKSLRKVKIALGMLILAYCLGKYNH